MKTMSRMTVMRSVWVVCEDFGFFNYGPPFAVFTTREAAEKFACAMWGPDRNKWQVTEAELRDDDANLSGG